MALSWSQHSYPVGTKVQHRNGYIVIKTEEGIIPESRRVWELMRGPLMDGDKVFHINGDRTDNRIQNLIRIHYNQVKFVLLKESKILWLPKSAKRDLTDEVLLRAKVMQRKRQREKVAVAA